MAGSPSVKTVYFVSNSSQGRQGFTSMTLTTGSLDPEVYDPGIVSDMLAFVTNSFGSLMFKLSVESNKEEFDLTSEPNKASQTLQTTKAWRTFVQDLLGASKVRVGVSTYSTPCRVAAAMRKRSSKGAQKTWWLLPRSDLFHPACVKALASTMWTSVFTFGLDYMETESKHTIEEKTDFVFKALDELCPDTLFSVVGVECVKSILGHHTGACFLGGLLNLVTKMMVNNKDNHSKSHGTCDVLNTIAKNARSSLLAEPDLLASMLAVKPDFLCVNINVDAFAQIPYKYYAVALRSSFADKVFFKAFFSRLQDSHFVYARPTIKFLQAEAAHNMHLVEFMLVWRELVLTRDFVEANIHDAWLPIELSNAWNEQHSDFDAVFARRAVWLSLNRFAKAPLCVKKDHDLALAALMEGAVKPEHLGPCWDDHAFVTRNIQEIAPQYVLCAPNLTPSLVALALNVVREELKPSWAKHQGAGDDAYLFLDMVHKAYLAFPNDTSIAQACLFRLSARNLNRDCQTFNARVAETWRRAFHRGANLDVVCCFARSVDLECAGSTIFASFHGNKQFASACVDNLNLMTANKLYVVDHTVLAKCLGTCCEDLDFAMSTLHRLGRACFASFFPTLQNNTFVLKLLDQMEEQ